MRNLRSYQEKAVKAIKQEKRLLLCLDMGLGKTISCLKAFKELKDEGLVSKALIVAPKYVATKTWPEEIDEPVWSHLINGLTYSVVSGTPKQREKALAKDVDIYITNKENLVWFNDNNNLKLDMLIWDESSSLKAAKMKTATGNKTRYAAGLEISKKVEYCVLLSGTPTPNGIEDIFGQSQFIKDGLLAASKFKFMNKYFINVSRTHDFPIWKALPNAKDDIVSLLGSKMYQLKSEDVLELPEAIYTCLNIDIGSKSHDIYKEMKDHSIVNIDDLEIAAESAGVKFGKLHQIGSGSIYYTTEEGKKYRTLHDEKVKELKEIYDENDANMLVFYYYQHEMEQIKKTFGKEAKFVSDANLDKFKKGELKILFAQPAQIGHGLNIQSGGSVIVWLTLPSSLELYQQANKRLHRSGQTASTVQIIHMIGTEIDNQIYNLLNSKGQTQDNFIRSLKSLAESL